MQFDVLSGSDFSTRSIGLESRDEIVHCGISDECNKYRPLFVAEICENDRLCHIITEWVFSKDKLSFIISGPSGCGKTTAAKLILDYLEVSYIVVSYKDFVKKFSFSNKSVLQQMHKSLTCRIIVIIADSKMDEKIIQDKCQKYRILIISKAPLGFKKALTYAFECPSRESMASILAWMCVESGLQLDENRIQTIERLSLSHDIRRAVTCLFLGQRECSPITWHDTDEDDIIQCYRVYENLDGPFDKVPGLLDTFCMMDMQMTQCPGYYFGAEICAIACEPFVAAERHTINARCAQVKGRVISLNHAFNQLGFTGRTEYHTISTILCDHIKNENVKKIPERMCDSWLTVMRFTNKVMNSNTRKLKDSIEKLVVKGT